jgi:hypothetical protein
VTSSEFASFVLAILVAQILFFGGMRALVELTDNEDFAVPVEAIIDEQEAPTSPVPVPPATESEAPTP